MSVSHIQRRVIGLTTMAAIALGSLVGVAPSASAHVSVQMYGEKANPGAYGAVFLRVPHGVEGKLTTQVDIEIPAGVTAVKPQHIAGWNERINFAADGTTATSVTWSGGALPNTSFADFGIQVKFPATPGATLYFKAVQTMDDGSIVSWIEIPAAGVDSHSLAKPSPSVKLADAVTDPHGGSGATDTHGSEASATKWLGDIDATVVKKTVRFVGDTSSTHSGKTATVKLMKNGSMTTLFTVKLDTRGDFVRTINRSKSGTGGYTLSSGDMVMLIIGGKTFAESKI